MILEVREESDRLVSGEHYKGLEERIRHKNPSKIPVLLYYAFDERTRVGPFVGPDKTLITQGIRDVAASLYQSGFENIRVVAGNWTNNIDMKLARLDGEIPQILGIGAMQINAADAEEKIVQARELGEKAPLIIGGGPHAIYQPWKFFKGYIKEGADVAVRGEQHVTLELMDTLLDYKTKKGTMREAFNQARREGAFDTISGLMYITEDGSHLVDTGPARMLATFDYLPRESLGFQHIEPKHKGKQLSSKPLRMDELKENGLYTIPTLFSRGCNLRCEYCPIPRQQQFTMRTKNMEKVKEDLLELTALTGVSKYFGTSDNISFSRKNLESYEILANADFKKKGIMVGDESTEKQLYNNRDLIPMLGKVFGGIWFGLEDLTSKIVKKGVKPKETIELFDLLKKNDILPMPMMIHYDGQPFKSSDDTLDGILNQVDFLYKHGAATVQVTYLTASTGSVFEDGHFTKGEVMKKVGKIPVKDWLYDGNHVMTTKEKNPYERQLNLFKVYGEFYNIGHLWDRVKEAWRNGEKPLKNLKVELQIAGLIGRAISYINSREWMKELKTNHIEYHTEPPHSSLPIKKLYRSMQEPILELNPV